ncbi:hypothetical protein PIB30_023341 [Stylosanthes scabra]|uniref:Uncharacterized protein n=1 Tax=Stylosanthes scabra TaxID=79078 RepID=A0ABU6TA70_9FABA|nr:hypothetical protein [Stylosanthes scabra]
MFVATPRLASVALCSASLFPSLRASAFAVASLSSLTPSSALICYFGFDLRNFTNVKARITQGDNLIGVTGSSGGMNINSAVIHVFMNHFIFEMKPLDAVQSPRIYHKVPPTYN